MNTINGMMKQSVYENQQKQVKTEGKGKSQAAPVKADKADKPEKAQSQPQDVVELGKNKDEVKGYQTYKPDMATVNSLKAMAQDHINTLRQMVEKLLGSQSYAVQGRWSESYSSWASLQSDNEKTMMSYGYSMEFKFEFSFSTSSSTSTSSNTSGGDAIRSEAAALVADDGPLGVQQVSANILNFAKAISGGDSSKADMLLAAVQKGFNQVAALFGGWGNLPDITNKTYDAVKEGFAAWKAEAAAAAEEEIA